jgi:hypothetical protein
MDLPVQRFENRIVRRSAGGTLRIQHLPKDRPMRLRALAALAFPATLMGCVETTTAPATIAPTAADLSSPAYQACVAAIATSTGRPASDIAVFN